MSDKLKISFAIFALILLPFLLMANNKIIEDTAIRKSIDSQVTNLLTANNIQEDTEMYGYTFHIAETKEDVDNEGYTRQLFEVSRGDKTHIWAYKTSNGSDIKYFRIMDKPNTSYELSTNYSLEAGFGAMIIVYIIYLFYLYWFAFKRKLKFKTIYGSGFTYFCFCALTPVMLGAFTYTHELEQNNMLKIINLNIFLLVSFFNITMVKYFNDLYKIASSEEEIDA